MKPRALISVILISIIGSHFAISNCNGQQSIQINSKETNWKFYRQYCKIAGSGCFDKSMSDDEMAGILLQKSGRNLKLSFTFVTLGFVCSSSIAYIKNPSDAVYYVIAGVSTGFLVAGIVELLSGYNKIGKAGIILQHKKFNLKTTGNTLSLNF
jgi:hypothetical protein